MVAFVTPSLLPQARPLLSSHDPIVAVLTRTRTIHGAIINHPSHRSIPEPPWTFETSHIWYQFHTIESSTARRYCPAVANNKNNINKNNKSNNNNDHPLPMSPLLTLLEVGDCTLGGIFCVEYTQSPIGPYREVAILSSLVGRPYSLFQQPALLGAWASHIFVDSQDAADYGQKIWGLPATVVPTIDFVPPSSVQDDEKKNDTTDNSNNNNDKDEMIHFAPDRITVTGWGRPENNGNANNNNKEEEGEKSTNKQENRSWFPNVQVSLPSFSGLLSTRIDNDSIDNDDNHHHHNHQQHDEESLSPLLQYPLTIVLPTTCTFQIGQSCKAVQYSMKDDDDYDKVSPTVSTMAKSTKTTLIEVQDLLRHSDMT